MKKIILFGDSIFNGFRNHHDTSLVTDLFRKQLASYAQVDNISKSGATTVEGVDYLRLVPPTYDLAVVEYGNNDASTAWGISPENYEKNLSKILTRLGPSVVIGLCYPNPANHEIMQFYGEKRLDLYNNIAHRVANQHHSPFVDILPVFRKLKDISTYYQPDGQHLTDKGNELLVKQIIPIIKKELD